MDPVRNYSLENAGALPPFSLNILEARKRGEHPYHGCLWVQFDWPKLAISKWCFCVPAGLRIDNLNLSFVAGLDLLICGAGQLETRVYELANQLRKFNPDKVLISFGYGYSNFIGSCD
jgi:hypothetical protein